MNLSRASTFLAAGLLLLSGAAALAAVSSDIDAPSPGAIGSINMDEGASPKAALPGASPPGLQRALPTDADLPQPAAEPAQPGNPLWAIPLKDLAATRDRPIFSQSRRPPAPAVIAAPAAPVVAPPKPAEPSRPLLKLVGTIIGASRGFGLFQDQAGNSALRLQTGEVHEGWVLREVRAHAIVFQKDDARVTLELPVQTTARPAPGDVTATTDPRGRR